MLSLPHLLWPLRLQFELPMVCGRWVLEPRRKQEAQRTSLSVLKATCGNCVQKSQSLHGSCGQKMPRWLGVFELLWVLLGS